MSHHVTCHVTVMSHASSSSLKRKRKKREKEIQKKRNIKSRKIDKRKRKMLVSKCSITVVKSKLQETLGYKLY